MFWAAQIVSTKVYVLPVRPRWIVRIRDAVHFQLSRSCRNNWYRKTSDVPTLPLGPGGAEITGTAVSRAAAYALRIAAASASDQHVARRRREHVTVLGGDQWRDGPPVGDQWWSGPVAGRARRGGGTVAAVRARVDAKKTAAVCNARTDRSYTCAPATTVTVRGTCVERFRIPCTKTSQAPHPVVRQPVCLGARQRIVHFKSSPAAAVFPLRTIDSFPSSLGVAFCSAVNDRIDTARRFFLLAFTRRTGTRCTEFTCDLFLNRQQQYSMYQSRARAVDLGPEMWNANHRDLLRGRYRPSTALRTEFGVVFSPSVPSNRQAGFPGQLFEHVHQVMFFR